MSFIGQYCKCDIRNVGSQLSIKREEEQDSAKLILVKACLKIFSFLNESELTKCRLVCREWKGIAPSGKIEYAVHSYFIKHGLTLSSAESCTGGRFASRITQIPESSRYFLGSVVSYSYSLKTEFLGVSEKYLKENGAVNAEVAAQMLKGLLERTKSDFGAAVTGVAGPGGGSPENPVGTVWCAVGQQQKMPRVWKIQATGNREMVIETSANVLYAELLRQSRSFVEF
jgi:PncC family amidohydrolase